MSSPAKAKEATLKSQNSNIWTIGSWADAINSHNLTEDHKSHLKPKWNKFISVIEYLPFVNFVYYAFVQMSAVDNVAMVSVGSIREICSLVGLVAALVYTVMTALPTATPWNEWEQIDFHFKSASAEEWETVVLPAWNDDSNSAPSTGSGIAVGRYGCQVHPGHPGVPMSVKLGNLYAGATIWLMVDIILSSLVLLSVSTLTQIKVKGGNGEMAVPDSALEKWWLWMRWIVVAMVGVLIIGASRSINAVSDTYYVKYPQPWLQNLCRDLGWVPIQCTDGSDQLCDEQGYEIFETETFEVFARKYVNGSFVKWNTNFDRSFGSALEYGSVRTDINGLDAARQSGSGITIMLGFSALTVFIAGYAQKFADDATKVDWRELTDDIVGPKSATTVSNTFGFTAEGDKVNEP